VSENSDRGKFYEFAGINDLAEFYRLRYASGEILDANYFDAVNRYDIRWSRTMWIYDNVRREAEMLDIGCGAGILALLKRKQVRLIGVDLSPACADAARRNGYDETHTAEMTALPFPDASFDYVVSLDVMGHIEFDQKDAVLSEIKRVLRPGGITMHGVECMNRTQQKDYAEMSDPELRHFISIDGHVGMEDEQANARRFGRFFEYVRTEPRYAVCVYAEELVKIADEYGLPRCADDFLDYIRSLSASERRAFNMAMGYVFGKISDLGIKMPASGYLLIKASDKPLGSFYGEHQDHRDLFAATIELGAQPVCLDRSSQASFNGDWYPAENLPPIARWMGRAGEIRFTSAPFSELRLDLTCHMPDVSKHPVGLHFFLNEKVINTISLAENGWVKVTTRLETAAAGASREPRDWILKIQANRTWQPCLTNPESSDDREISVAVCNVEIVL